MSKKTQKASLPKNAPKEYPGVQKRLVQLMGGRSQRGWGRELGVSQQNLSRYMLGDATPHMSFLVLLANKEHVNLNWLLLGEGRMTRR